MRAAVRGGALMASRDDILCALTPAEARHFGGALAETIQEGRLSGSVAIGDALVRAKRRAANDEPIERIGQDVKRTEAEEPAEGIAYFMADDVDALEDGIEELVERTLTYRGIACLYGDSNSGKTFLAVDMGCAVARESPWMYRNVDGGLVVYLAAESPASIKRRLRAYRKHHQCDVPRFAVTESPINLFDGAADTKLVIALIHQLESELGERCVLVIGDTLARLSAGANENAGEDMGVVLAHVDRIRNEFGCAFLLVHHVGKDSARGMRGWSGIRAHIDTEIEVTADEQTGARAAEITKQRDIGGKGERIGFRLDVVDLGVGKWDKPVTSCVVTPADAPPKTTAAKRPSEIAGAIVELLTGRGAGMRKGDIVDHFAGRYTKGAVYREIKKLVEGHRLRDVIGIVGLVTE